MEKVVGKDPKAIWTNCPNCARKHLSAAYALLTDAGRGVMVCSPGGVLVARAMIALSESTNGYVGNRTLAIGCLAAAETSELTDPKFARLHRNVRTMVEKKADGQAALDLLRQGCILPRDSMIAAHITEACRELPDLYWNDDTLYSLFSPAGFRCDNIRLLADRLVEIIRDLEDTYALETVDDVP